MLVYCRLVFWDQRGPTANGVSWRTSAAAKNALDDAWRMLVGHRRMLVDHPPAFSNPIPRSYISHPRSTKAHGFLGPGISTFHLGSCLMGMFRISGMGLIKHGNGNSVFPLKPSFTTYIRMGGGFSIAVVFKCARVFVVLISNWIILYYVICRSESMKLLVNLICWCQLGLCLSLARLEHFIQEVGRQFFSNRVMVEKAWTNASSVIGLVHSWEHQRAE